MFTSTDIALVMGVAYISFMVMAFALPFMAFSATRSLRRIANELERMNGAPVQTAAPSAPVTATWIAPPAPPSLGHTLLR